MTFGATGERILDTAGLANQLANARVSLSSETGETDVQVRGKANGGLLGESHLWIPYQDDRKARSNAAIAGCADGEAIPR